MASNGRKHRRLATFTDLSTPLSVSLTSPATEYYVLRIPQQWLASTFPSYSCTLHHPMDPILYQQPRLPVHASICDA